MSSPLPLPSFSFGIVSPLDDERVKAALNVFCGALGQRLGFPIKRHRATSPTALAIALQKQTIQAAWVSPTLLVSSPHLAEAVPLVCSQRAGVSFYHAALFVPASSKITSVMELQNTRAAWVAPSSAAGYIIPRLSLARRGLSLNTLFWSESFHESHLGVCRAVARGQAEVGATYAVFTNGDPNAALLRAGFLECPETVKARVIDTSGPVPSDMVVVSPSVPVAQRTLISSALRALSEDTQAKAAMQAIFGTSDFAPFSPAAHKELRALLQTAKALGALPQR